MMTIMVIERDWKVVGVAEAKAKFSELLERVGRGERVVVAKRGKLVAVLAPPDAVSDGGDKPRGLAMLAGALTEWPELEHDMNEVVPKLAGPRAIGRFRIWRDQILLRHRRPLGHDAPRSSDASDPAPRGDGTIRSMHHLDHVGELVYGAAKAGSAKLADRVRELVTDALPVVPFDASAHRSTDRCAPRWSPAASGPPSPIRHRIDRVGTGPHAGDGQRPPLARIQGLRVEDWLRG